MAVSQEVPDMVPGISLDDVDCDLHDVDSNRCRICEGVSMLDVIPGLSCMTMTHLLDFLRMKFEDLKWDALCITIMKFAGFSFTDELRPAAFRKDCLTRILVRRWYRCTV